MEETKDMMAPAEETSAPATNPAEETSAPTPAPAKTKTKTTPAKSKKKKKKKKPVKKPTPPPDPKEDGEEDEPQVSKTKRIVNTVVNVVLIIAIVMAAISTYISFMSTSGSGVPNLFGVALMTVESNSMSPKINEGDLVVGKAFSNDVEKRHEAALALRPGDIITYQTIINGEPALNTHGIYNVYDGGDYVYFETKGENNDYVDPATVHESSLEAKYLFHIPALGNVVKYIQSPTGFFLVVVVPVLIFFIFHLVQFFRVLFEYQNVKMLIKYEQERGRTEDLIESQIKDQKTRDEIRRAAIEAEVREQLRREMLAEIANSHKNEAADAAKSEESEPEAEIPAEEAPAEIDAKEDTTEQ